ncbi:MAG TPA: type II secretion system protein [Dehalococcoidia bacterium]|nr:type II secretion system protein [Dehalococcoidia bacterium]
MITRKLFKGEKGFTLLETIVALVLMSIISVAFLSGLASTSSSRALAEERVSGKILAEAQMEYIKKQPYSDNYSQIDPDGYEGYTANVTVVDFYYNLQKITVTVYHYEDDVFSLESFKVKRRE